MLARDTANALLKDTPAGNNKSVYLIIPNQSQPSIIFLAHPLALAPRRNNMLTMLDILVLPR